VYPDIGIDSRKFFWKPRNYWKDLSNVKNFFVEFAEDMGFSPLNPKNWYSVTVREVLSRKGGSSVLGCYNNSLATALLQTFPDIRLNASRFGDIHQNWQDITERKKFFEEYADEKDFDLYDAENWYSVTTEDLLARKGARSILDLYQGSFVVALLHLFPELELSTAKLRANLPTSHWRDKRNQRRFFFSFAKDHSFDLWFPKIGTLYLETL